MRQIKFRGKSSNPDSWIYGSFVKIYNKGYFIHDTLNNPVLEQTIGQFTGIIDCNGKEIYEGDIVKISSDISSTTHTGVVIFRDGCFGVYNKNQYRKFHPLYLKEEVVHDMSATMKFKYTFEVIGNIHDNPQLLKTESKHKMPSALL